MAVDLVGYLLRIAPAMVVVIALYVMLRGKQALPLRIMVVVIGFLIVRDTLILFQVWGYGLGDGWLPYVRFVNEPLLVVGFAVGVLVVTALLVLIERDGRSLLHWITWRWWSLLWAFGGGAVIAGALIIAYLFVPLADRGGAVPADMLWPLVAIAIFGNLTEDVLVRGYFQGWVATVASPVRAAIASGLFYALGHVFIATQIMHGAWPILVFALFDGLVCAFVRMKAGLLPAAVSHGMGIAVLATGLI